MRRSEFLSSAIGAFSVLAPALPVAANSDPAAELANIERTTGGRLGVMAIDTESGRTVSHRADERFPMCSTFKFLAVAAILSRVDRGIVQLQRRVTYTKADLLEYAPVTREHVNEGAMTLEALCAAAIEYSDNTAANLLLKELGGPHGVTAYARTLGDMVTTLNRTEPTLNTAIPGDVRDTTTPAAMAADLRAVLLGTQLNAQSKNKLTNWLFRCRTGDALLRAGLPSTWRVGDKTGLGGPKNASGDSNTRNDIAIAWPPHRAPLLIATYLTGSTLRASGRDSAIASVGRLIASHPA